MSPKSTAIFVFYLLFVGGGLFACGWLADGYWSLGGNIGSLIGLVFGVTCGVFIGAQQAWYNEAMEYISLNTSIELEEILDSLGLGDEPEKEGDEGN